MADARNYKAEETLMPLNLRVLKLCMVMSWKIATWLL